MKHPHLKARLSLLCLLAVSASLAGAQQTMPEGFYINEGTSAGGALRSLYAVDSNAVTIASAPDGNGIPAASLSVAFHVPSAAPSAILHAETGTAPDGGMLQAYLYSPSAGGLALGAQAPSNGVVEFAITGAQLAQYRDASGALNVQFRAYRPSGAFTWTVERLVILTPIASSFVYDNEGGHASGTLASLRAVDGDLYTLTTAAEASGNGNVSASFSVGYQLPAGTPSATLHAVTGLPSGGGNLQAFAYYAPVGGTTLGVAPVPSGSGVVDLPITSSQIATYRDASGTLNVQFRVYAPASSVPSGTAWATDQLVLWAAPNNGPALPTSLAASLDGNGAVDLTWTDNANNETGFIVERKGGADADFVQIGTAPANSIDFQDASSLWPGTTYTYRVRSTNGNGDSPNSNEASATVTIAGPQNPVAAATGPTKVTLYWSAVAGALGYDVYRSNSEDSGFMKINQSPVGSADPGPGVANGLMFTDTGLTSGTAYFYKIAAVTDSSGSDGPFSDVVSDVPTARAIPWDSGDAQAIINKVNYERYQDTSGWDPNGWIVAVGPNGVQYGQVVDGGLPQTSTSTLLYDPVTSTLSTPDLGTFPFLNENPPKNPLLTQVEGNYANAHDTGILRKVEAVAGHHSFRGLVFFPSTTYGLNAASAVGDTADIYTGGATLSGAKHAQNMDVGFQKGSDDTSGEKGGWQIIAFFNDPRRKGNHGFLSQQKDQAAKVRGVRVYGAAYLSLQIPGSGTFGMPRQTVGFVVDARDAGGTMSGSAEGVVCIQLFVPNFTSAESQYFSFKRCNTIAQNAAAVGKGNGYKRTGSYVRYASWGNQFDPEDQGCLLDGNDWEYNDTAYSGAYPGRGRNVSWNDGYKFYEEDTISLATNP